MNGSNFAPPTSPDFDKMVWTCPCCNQQRTDKFIKVMTHDVSTFHGLETGTMFINCKYCADMEGCKEKAHDRAWVLKKFLNKSEDNVRNNIEL
jgi:hypothetical protein